MTLAVLALAVLSLFLGWIQRRRQKAGLSPEWFRQIDREQWARQGWDREILTGKRQFQSQFERETRGRVQG